MVQIKSFILFFGLLALTAVEVHGEDLGAPKKVIIDDSVEQDHDLEETKRILDETAEKLDLTCENYESRCEELESRIKLQFCLDSIKNYLCSGRELKDVDNFVTSYSK